MALQKLQFRPGINNDFPKYANEDGWVDCDKVRFRFGFPEKIGGWTRAMSQSFLGSCRTLHGWTTLKLEKYIGIGTNLKYTVSHGGTFTDVTPLRSTSSAGDATFSASSGSSTITVTHTDHGARENDFVTFSGAVSLGGNMGASVLNQEFKIDTVVDSNRYEITARTASTGIFSYVENGELDVSDSEVSATSSDSGNGGSSIVAKYQINRGLDFAVFGDGWGAGTYGGRTPDAKSTQLNGAINASATSITVDSSGGITAGDTIRIGSELILVGAVSSNTFTGCTRGSDGTTATSHSDNVVVQLALNDTESESDFTGWGDAANVGVLTETLRLWNEDNFGENLLINYRGGGIYQYDPSSSTTRATALSDLNGATGAPTKAFQIMTSDIDRHVIAFGVTPLNETEIDPLLVRFSDQESVTDWTPSTTNTAGDLRLGTGTEIMQAVETRQQTLIYTDSSLHAMQYIGPPYTFGINLISDNITIMSPKAAVAVEDSVYWMGNGGFYVYTGMVQQVPCTVKEKVFNNLNREQAQKIICGVNSTYSEVWWFYPSKDSLDNDRYVIYNYEQNIWYYGALNRTAWIDRGIQNFPIAASTDGYLYYHESDLNDGSTTPPTAITAFIESSPSDIGDGDRLSYISRMIPDFSFTGSTRTNASVDVTLTAFNYSGGLSTSAETAEVNRKTIIPIQSHTKKNDLRLRGRAVSVKVQSDETDTTWRLGVPRIDIKQDGGR